jgi:hypothetical protein
MVVSKPVATLGASEGGARGRKDVGGIGPKGAVGLETTI